MSEFFRKNTIPFLVFVTGASVLIIEISALRILSPYFGNTIFTASSVISVILAALSIGYYAGGRLADKHPKEFIFYYIIAGSGLAVILLYVVGLVILPVFGYKLSIVQGPLITSFLLFFLQSLLLGMLSPFAIKLQTMRLQELGVGTASGEIFFWSTLGSIAGSLSAGFFFIPHVGIDKILLGTGFLLIILGLFGNLKLAFRPKVFLVLVLAASSLFFISRYDAQAFGVLYSKDSLYQKITIYDGEYAGQPARFLLQDRNSSAAEFLNSPDLAYEYTEYYAAYQIFNPDATQMLSIGAGAYSVPKAILAEVPKAKIDVVEIDPELLPLGKQYFGVKDDPRMASITQDGRRFLHDADKKYDFIFSDAYSSFYSIPSHMATREFFEIAKEKLADNGIFMANVIGSLELKPESFLLSEMKTFLSVFPNSYFFAVRSPDSTQVQNIIFIGYNSSRKVDMNSTIVKKNKNRIIADLGGKIIRVDKIDFSRYSLLTDNFVPVDYLMSKDLSNLY